MERNLKISNFWLDFVSRNPIFKNIHQPKSAYFSDNEEEANNLSKLVIEGIKTATCGSLQSYINSKMEIPNIGDLWIVTDFYGNPICVTKTVNVFKIKYKDVTQKIAKLEGEGNLSLKYWQKTHWAFFEREFKNYNLKPSLEMILVFDEFIVMQ